MSEFQYYQFQSIDRRLTKEDREYLKTKSSRVKLETHGARFTYSSGDFRGNPLEVLDRCFDMMSYIANFGDRQIAFRFPKNALDLEVLQPYAIPYCIEFKTTQKSTIVNIALSAEDFYGGWIDEKHDGLSPLLPLYDDLLKGDLSVLYLAWHRADTCEEIEKPESSIELPVPPSLAKPSPALQEYMTFFNIQL